MKKYTIATWVFTWAIGSPILFILTAEVEHFYSINGITVLYSLTIIAWAGTLIYALWNEGWRPKKEVRT